MLNPQTVFVDKRFEISNLDLIRDMINIMKLEVVITNSQVPLPIGESIPEIVDRMVAFLL